MCINEGARPLHTATKLPKRKASDPSAEPLEKVARRRVLLRELEGTLPFPPPPPLSWSLRSLLQELMAYDATGPSSAPATVTSFFSSYFSPERILSTPDSPPVVLDDRHRPRT